MNALAPTEDTIGMVKVLFPQLRTVKDEEIAKAIGLAKALGLNPVKREVHFVPFNGQVQLVVSYTEYIKRARHLLNGFEVAIGKDDIDTYAECTIYRKDWQYPFKWRVYMKEAQKSTRTWQEMPMFMLKKVAIAQAFRLAFPEEIAELPLTSDEIQYQEMNASDSGHLDKAPSSSLPATALPSQPTSLSHSNSNSKTMTEPQRKKMFMLFKELGITEREQILEYIQNVIGRKIESSKELSIEEASKVIDALLNGSVAEKEEKTEE